MQFNTILIRAAGVAWIILTIYGLLVTNGVIPELIEGVF